MTESENGYRFWAEQIGSDSDNTTENISEPVSETDILTPEFETIEPAPSTGSIAAEIPLAETTGEAATPTQIEPSTESVPAADEPLTFTAYDANRSSEPFKKHKKEKKPKKHPVRRFCKKAVGFLAAAAVFGCVAGTSFIGVTSLYYHFNPDARPKLPTNATQDKTSEDLVRPTISSTNVATGTAITTTDVSGIVEEAMPSLVSISCTFRTSTSFFGYLYEGTTEGSGSGIIVGNNDTELLIATNNHVIDDALTITVTFADGSTQSAIIKGTDSSNDLAIISVPLTALKDDTREAISIATLGSSDDVKVGQMVIAIGNALGYGQTTTVGYISAKERDISMSDSATGNSTTMTALQVDAAINPGNSGGALLNVNGEVIGINSAKLSDTAVEGIGYAIPISNVLDILTDLMNREVLTEEERGYLGVYLSQQDITAEVSEVYGWPIGVYVTETAPNGAGAKYGILAGDIITGINGSKITSYAQLQEKVTSYRSGTTISVTLQRMENGSWQEHVLDVVLGSKADFDEE